MQEEKIIEVRRLSAGYAGRTILSEVSFDVRQGEIFIILGGSGSGKSTLLKNMIGLYPAMSGEVLIRGENMIGAVGAIRERLLRQFGVMYQGGALFGSMTLAENVALPLEECTRLPREARALLARGAPAGAEKRRGWVEGLNAIHRKLMAPEWTPTSDGVNFAQVVVEIGKHLAPNAAVTSDAGNF